MIVNVADADSYHHYSQKKSRANNKTYQKNHDNEDGNDDQC